MRQAFLSLPNQIGVTATLNLSYLKPTFANQYLVIRTGTVDVKGRKVWVKGFIETLEGERLVEAECVSLYLVVKWLRESFTCTY